MSFVLLVFPAVGRLRSGEYLVGFIHIYIIALVLDIGWKFEMDIV